MNNCSGKRTAMDNIGPNVFRLYRKACRKPDGSSWQGEHGPYIVSEDAAEVECGNCGEKLSPMSVLIAYARKENRIADRFRHLQQEVEKAEFKAERQNRVRCEHCEKLTRIRK